MTTRSSLPHSLSLSLSRARTHTHAPSIPIIYCSWQVPLTTFSVCTKLPSRLFAHSLFYLTHRYDPIRCYHSELEWTWEQWQWRGTPHSPNLQGWSLAIRLFYILSRSLVGGEVLPLWRKAVSVFFSSSQLDC